MEGAMLYAFEQEVPIDETTYRKIMQRLGSEPLAGQLVHMAVRTSEGTLRYIDVWTSKAAYKRAVEERIHPAVSAVFRELEFRPSAEPRRQMMDLIDLLPAPVRETEP
jgi:hypothetical protein